MNRRRPATSGSLDLLLDTICNTFGGILFVAMLVVVMLQMTAKSNDAQHLESVSESELLELERQQAEVKAELDSYVRASALQLAQVSLVDPTATTLWNELLEIQKERHSLVDTKLQTLGRTAKLQANVSRIRKSLHDMESQDKEWQRKNTEVTLAIAQETKKRTHDAELPRVRTSGKSEVQTTLRYGRFYIWHKYDANGSRNGLNTDEFIILEDTPIGLVTTQLPYAGTAIDGSDDTINEVALKLKRFAPRRHYIQVSVWPDSFEQFRHLKAILVDNGFDYRLTPAQADAQFVDRGGNSEGIQ